MQPVDPPAALKARLPGLVILQLRLGKDGTAREVKVLRPGSLGMTESAEAAVRQWRWEPALFNGRPVEALMTITITFALPSFAAGEVSWRPCAMSEAARTVPT